MAAEWHAGRVGLARSTTAQHRSYLDSLILPTFGRSPIAEITTADVRQWVHMLDTAGKAPATIRKALAILRAILAQAVEDRRLAASPAAGRIELPATRRSPMTILTADQAWDLADAAGIFYRTHLAAAAQTGLRWGELAGLDVAALDLLAGEVAVTQQLTEVGGHLEVRRD